MRLPAPIATLLLACVLLTQASHATAAAPPTADFVASGGKRVRVERFVPKEEGRRPAVILLHGLDGMEGNESRYRSLAKRLVAKGYLAVLVHYFDRTGTTKKDLPALLEKFRACLDSAKGERWRDVDATFAAWLEAVNAAVADTRQHPRADPDRVALVGVSLGGFLATAAASREDSGVRCVVDLFGGLPLPLAEQARHMPPALLVHGDADEVVPVREANSLRDLLAARRRVHEVKVYKGVGHCFVCRDGSLDWLSAWRAECLAQSFLARHLRADAPKASVSR